MKGVPLGITIVAGMPSRPAWYATPCAWLPADMATTPAFFCASVSVVILAKVFKF
jgi:hypothetical protein